MDADNLQFSQHADVLARGIHHLGLGRDSGHLLNAADWLFAASSTVSVDCVTSQHDDSIFWCATAAEFEDRRSKLWAAHLTELSRFTFCWTGFESLLKGLFSKAELRKGFMPALMTRFKGFKTADLSNSLLCVHLRLKGGRLAEELEKLNNPTPCHQKALDKLLFNSFLGQGAIEAIKSLRNAFAHGGFYLPFPDSDICEEDQMTRVISLSISLLLIVSQYLVFLSISSDELSMRITLPYELEDEPSLSQLLLAGCSLDFFGGVNGQLDLLG